jgi:hypothetical protein
MVATNKRGRRMKYTIQSLVRGSENSWYSFDEADDKEKAELRLKWIEYYYKDDTFRLKEENENEV